MSIEFLENVSIAWEQTVLLCPLKDLFTQIVGTLKIACLLSVADRFVRIPICLASLFQRDYCFQTVLSSRGEKREFAVTRVSPVSATQHTKGGGVGGKVLPGNNGESSCRTCYAQRKAPRTLDVSFLSLVSSILSDGILFTSISLRLL